MFLDYFALFVLILLATSVLAIWLVLGMLPGRIARDRQHPQAAAISVCGWWGVITMGLLLPLAYIWAYTSPRCDDQGSDEAATAEEGEAT